MKESTQLNVSVELTLEMVSLLGSSRQHWRLSLKHPGKGVPKFCVCKIESMLSMTTFDRVRLTGTSNLSFSRLLLKMVTNELESAIDWKQELDGAAGT